MTCFASPPNAASANPPKTFATQIIITASANVHQDSSGVIMTSQIVNLAVSATIPIDCDFWSEDDGWKGCCKSPSVTVNGRNIEDAKKNMATELQTHIGRILGPAS